MNDDLTTKKTVGLFPYSLGVAMLWSLLIAISLIWNIKIEKTRTYDTASIEARTAFEKDIVYRRWNAENDGVYGLVSDKTQPNPYLNASERDIITPWGKKLTKINPAYMTRQVHELANQEYGVKGHITSLNPIRPANTPDSWETQALKSFEAGKREVSSVEEMDGKHYLRLMRPLLTEGSCLKCHAEQGYKLGDIRGGISVSVPMAPFRVIERSRAITFSLVLGLLWFIGLAGIGFSSFRLSQQRHKRMIAEEAIRKSEAKYRSMIDSMEDEVYICSFDFRTEYLNPSMRKRLGFDATGEFCHKAIYGLDGKCPWCIHAKVIKGDIINTEVVNPESGRTYHISNSPILNTDGSISKLSICRDITERKEAEEELKKHRDHLEALVKERTIELNIAKEHAEAASEAKSLFINNMSHEFRTPLNGIIVSAELALGQEIPPKVENNLKTIHRSGRSLLNAVTAILDFSKSEDGRLWLAANPFRLDEVMQKLSGTFIQKGAEKMIEISFDIVEDEVSNALIGDPDRLVDVFNHLLDNAAKFSMGVPKATIGAKNVNTSGEKSTLEFYVKDNGIGIASENFEKIFDAFTQIDASRTRQYDGSGMGLAVSKRIVEAMGGTIWVESELGKGSTFYFTASFVRQRQEHPFKTPAFENRKDQTIDRMSSKADGEMGKPKLLLELLSKIGPLIQKLKPKPCKEIIAEISKYTWPEEFSQEIVELDRLISKYKFRDAQTVFNSLIEKLKSD